MQQHLQKASKSDNEKLSLFRRLLLAWSLIKDDFDVEVKLKGGHSFNFKTNTLTFNDPTHFHCTENFYITSDKHLVLSSGRTKISEDSNLVYSICENCDLDENGQPVLIDYDIPTNIHDATIEAVPGLKSIKGHQLLIK